MKKYLFGIILFSFLIHPITAQFKISDKENTTINTNAVLDIESSKKGILIPRLTTAGRDSILHPTESLMIFNTTTKEFQVYNGTSWQAGLGSTVVDTINVRNTLATKEYVDLNKKITVTSDTNGYVINSAGSRDYNNPILTILDTVKYDQLIGINGNHTALQVMAPNMIAGSRNYIEVGSRHAPTEAALIGYVQVASPTAVGDSTKDNFLTLGLNGAEDLLTINGRGRVNIKNSFSIGSISKPQSLFVNGEIDVLGNFYIKGNEYIDGDLTVQSCTNCIPAKYIPKVGTIGVVFTNGAGNLELPNGITFDRSTQKIYFTSECGAFVTNSGNATNYNRTIPMSALAINGSSVVAYNSDTACQVNFVIINNNN